MVLNAGTTDPEQDRTACYSSDLVAEQGLDDAAVTLDWDIKAAFDPERVFPDYGQDL